VEARSRNCLSNKAKAATYTISRGRTGSGESVLV
jgi:hypothetical protein